MAMASIALPSAGASHAARGTCDLLDGASEPLEKPWGFCEIIPTLVNVYIANWKDPPFLGTVNQL